MSKHSLVHPRRVIPCVSSAICTSQIDESQVVHIMGDGAVHLIAGDAIYRKCPLRDRRRRNVHFVIDEEEMRCFLVESALLDSTQVRLPPFVFYRHPPTIQLKHKELSPKTLRHPKRLGVKMIVRTDRKEANSVNDTCGLEVIVEELHASVAKGYGLSFFSFSM